MHLLALKSLLQDEAVVDELVQGLLILCVPVLWWMLELMLRRWMCQTKWPRHKVNEISRTFLRVHDEMSHKKMNYYSPLYTN